MCSIFDTELWSILDGLTLLLNRNLNRILIKTNSLEVIHALLKDDSTSSRLALVRQIQQIYEVLSIRWSDMSQERSI
ncbi:hypothetical protein PVK06_013104 [Gossypium arboreum]|uniref:RNase H type-1 domain-containing protein n=1 Tax=Gossypium arboreum TaxID=29729 RepID=A0ABR0QD95_GOSAR|nr:hypothetical protein PVK06_013104 [Gossypium arboreum]